MMSVHNQELPHKIRIVKQPVELQQKKQIETV